MDDTRDGRIGVGLRIYRDRKSLLCARNHESYRGNGGHTGAASDGGPQGPRGGNTGVGYSRHSVYCGLPDREERSLDTGGDARGKKVAGRVLVIFVWRVPRQKKKPKSGPTLWKPRMGHPAAKRGRIHHRGSRGATGGAEER